MENRALDKVAYPAETNATALQDGCLCEIFRKIDLRMARYHHCGSRWSLSDWEVLHVRADDLLLPDIDMNGFADHSNSSCRSMGTANPQAKTVLLAGVSLNCEIPQLR